MQIPSKDSASPKSTSIRNEFELLRAITQDPNSIDAALRARIRSFLSTQGNLAAFESPEHGILGMSLNTHKTIANRVVDGGYEALNDYRKAALEKLKRVEKQELPPARGRIDWYRNELAAKNDQLARVANDIALMAQRLDEILALAEQMAEAAGRAEEFQKRRSELLKKFR